MYKCCRDNRCCPNFIKDCSLISSTSTDFLQVVYTFIQKSNSSINKLVIRIWNKIDSNWYTRYQVTQPSSVLVDFKLPEFQAQAKSNPITSKREHWLTNSVN